MPAKKTLARTLAAGVAACALAFPVAPAFAQTPDDMLVIAQRIDDIVTLDPAEAFEFAGIDTTRNIYSKLVNFFPDDLDQYQGDLAESWEVSDDGLTITFTMKEGMTFHSGNPVRAEDAEFSLHRVVKLNKTPSFILTQFGFTADNVEERIVADGNTLSITLDQPYAVSFVLNCLGAGVASIVDKELVLENEVDGDLGNAWLSTNSAGSGAYSLASWTASESVMLEENPDYYRGDPAMSRVVIRHVTESATQRLLLERGDIDIARNLNPEDIEGIEGNEDLKIHEETRSRLMYFAMNQKHPELSKPEVREALKYLPDYEGMANSFLKGQWRVHQSFLPAGYLGAIEDTPYSFDIEKARALLEEADVGEITLGVGVRDAQERIEIAQTLQNAFSQVGITLDITVGTGAQTLAKYRARELDIYVGAWGVDYPDPHTNANTFAFNPDNSDEANATGILAWRNSWDPTELSEKTAAATLEGDNEVRAQMYEEIQREFQETSPFAIMFQKVEQNGLRANVEGLNLGGAITDVTYWTVTK